MTLSLWAVSLEAGGAGGLALAARLSEVESQSVLVLEAGPFPEVVKAYSTPGASQQVLGTGTRWHLGGRRNTYMLQAPRWIGALRRQHKNRWGTAPSHITV